MRALCLLLCLACGKKGGFRMDAGPESTGFDERPIDQTIMDGEALVAVDIDRDGDMDVVAAVSGTARVHLYLNEGAGNRWSTVEIGTIRAVDVEVVDVDADGDLDVLALGLVTEAGPGFPRKLVWFESPGNPRETWTEHEIAGGGVDYVVKVADLTGNGLPDLIAAGDAGVVWVGNLGAGLFELGHVLDLDLERTTVLQVFDMNGDFVDDLVVSGPGLGEIVWYENTRPPNTTATNPTFIRHSLGAVGATDFSIQDADGDADADLIALSSSGISIFSVPMDGDSAEPWSPTEIVTFSGGERLVAGDLDGDTDLDLVVSTPDALHLFAQDGEYTETILRSGYTGLRDLGAGDIDGNGRMDLLTATADTIAWWVNRL